MSAVAPDAGTTKPVRFATSDAGTTATAASWAARWIPDSGITDLLIVCAPTVDDALHAAEQAGGTVVVVPADWVENNGPIVVATGHDLDSDAAITPAIALARRHAVPLVLLHVWGMPGTGTVTMPPDPYGVGSIPVGQAAALELLTERQRHLHPGLVFTSEVRQSTHVAPEIVAAASTASAIVVGRGGRHARHPQLGHTARELITRSPCPVVIAPNPTTRR
ncbi:MAG: universal stress protein [Acidobacteria bacterium]|nr:universal stress protein [Acidobacteriota bacterium]